LRRRSRRASLRLSKVMPHEPASARGSRHSL
jgi:hypothetical protein